MNSGIRKVFRYIHLWLGLASGIVLFVVCLSGTIYTFRTEIDELLNKEKYYIVVPKTPVPMHVDSLVAIVGRTQKATVTGFAIPSKNNKAWAFTLKTLDKNKGNGPERNRQVSVNPYTGQVLGGTTSGRINFFSTVMKVHRWLLMERKTGSFIVGVATIIFVFFASVGNRALASPKDALLETGFCPAIEREVETH